MLPEKRLDAGQQAGTKWPSDADYHRQEDPEGQVTVKESKTLSLMGGAQLSADMDKDVVERRLVGRRDAHRALTACCETNSSTAVRIVSRTARVRASRSCSSPVKEEGSSNPQWIFVCMPGKIGQREALASSQTVIT